jgi:hypothetical protein
MRKKHFYVSFLMLAGPFKQIGAAGASSRSLSFCSLAQIAMLLVTKNFFITFTQV